MRARSAVFTAQGKGDVRALGAAEDQLREGLGRLFALAEAYPELRANESFRHLQQRITELEEAIADRRELYNEAVNLNNIRVQTFPDLLVARWLQFPNQPLLEFKEEQKRDVDLATLFDRSA
jgi:LemA protein